MLDHHVSVVSAVVYIYRHTRRIYGHDLCLFDYELVLCWVWTLRDSNARPLPCKGSVLPTELRARLVNMMPLLSGINVYYWRQSVVGIYFLLVLIMMYLKNAHLRCVCSSLWFAYSSWVSNIYLANIMLLGFISDVVKNWCFV